MPISDYIARGKSFHESQKYFALKYLKANELRPNDNVDIKLMADLNGDGTYGLENMSHISAGVFLDGSGQTLLHPTDEDLKEIRMRHNNQVTDLNLLDPLSTAVWADANGATRADEHWHYDSAAPNTKINWYFYGDVSNNLQVRYDELDMVYALVDIDVSGRDCWWAVYSHIQDASAGGLFYQTRWNFTEVHLADSAIKGEKVCLYINPNSNAEPADVFPHLEGYPAINLGTPDVTGTGNPDEKLLFIALNTDGAIRDHKFTLYETGTKMTGLKGKIFRTLA